MIYFPLFFDLSEKNVLVIGCGKIASRRISSLYPFAGQVTVISPSFSEDIQALAKESRLRLINGIVTEQLLPEIILLDYDIVLAATNQPELNESIADFCHEAHILVNTCSDQSQCDFFFPALISTEDIVVGICGNGKNHRKVSQTAFDLRQHLNKLQ